MLMGRLGQDPELRYTPSGAAVANFSLATTEQWTDKSGQRQERTEWHRIVVWGKLGELCNQYLAKGRQALIEGSLQTRSWDGNDGAKRYTTEVIARNVQFIGGRPSDSSDSQGRAPFSSDDAPHFDQSADQYQVANDSNFTADDIPF